MNDDVKELMDEVYYSHCSSEDLIRIFDNPLTKYVGKYFQNILDIGAGQSSFALDMIRNVVSFTAVDADAKQLEYLRSRIEKFDKTLLNKLHLINGNFKDATINYSQYDCIIFSNILHFISLDNINKYFSKILPTFREGTVIYISVHSKKHPAISRKNSFEHFYSTSEIKNIFNGVEFEIIHDREFKYEIDQIERSWIAESVRKACVKLWDITDENKIEHVVKSNETNFDGYGIEFVIQKK